MPLRLRPSQMTGIPAAVKLGLAYDIGGRGDQSFNDLAAAEPGQGQGRRASTVTGELAAAPGRAGFGEGRTG